MFTVAPKPPCHWLVTVYETWHPDAACAGLIPTASPAPAVASATAPAAHDRRRFTGPGGNGKTLISVSSLSRNCSRLSGVSAHILDPRLAGRVSQSPDPRA